MKETDITPFFHTRWCFLLMILLSVGSTVFAYLCGDVFPFPGADGGFVLPSSESWVTERTWSLGTGIGLSLASAVIIGYINKGFNVLRHITWLFAGLFLVMQAACPSVMGQLYDGGVLCCVLLLAIVPLFLSFQNPRATREVYLAFCLVSFGSLTDVAYVGFLVVLLIGCIQMQCLKFKSFLAMLLGIITPYWIVFGSGIVSLSEVRVPEFTGIFEEVPTGEAVVMLASAGLTMFLGVVAGVLNLVKVYSYNARTRAYNGFFLVVFLMSCILALVDYGRFVVYLPVISLGASFQIGHFFVINNQKRAYIPILTIIAIYGAIYFWSITAY